MHPKPAAAAFGLRLTPRWAELRGQGLDNLKMLVTPVKQGGQGVTYFNWGIYFVSAITLCLACHRLALHLTATPVL